MKHLYSLLILLIVITACSESPETTAEAKLEVAVVYNNEVDSLAWINKQIIETPGDASLYLTKAKYYVSNQNSNLAIEEVDKAISIDSMQVAFVNFKGDVFYDAHNLIDAKSAYLKSLEIDEVNIHANLKLAWISLVAGQHDACFVYSNEALKQNQYMPEPYYLKGLAYKELGTFKLAVSNFRTATEQDNDYKIAWLQLGYMYDAAEDTLAGAFYENALRVDSNYIDALYAFGMHLQKWGLAEEAVKQYQHIIRIDDNYHDAYYNIGFVYLELTHQNDSALKYYDKVLALNKYNFKGYYNRALTYERMEMYAQARTDLEKALELKPDNIEAALAMSRVQDKR